MRSCKDSTLAPLSANVITVHSKVKDVSPKLPTRKVMANGKKS